MSASIPRLLFCVVLMASLAGCGGSSGGSTGCVSNCGGGGGTPTTVTYTFTGAMPTAVATKIGTGAYTQATLASGKLSISVPSGTSNFAVAYVCPALPWFVPPFTNEYVYQASTLDGTSFGGSCTNTASPQYGTATVQVNTSAIPAAHMVTVQDLDVMGASGGTIDFSGPMTVGTYDVFIFAQDIDDNLLALKILRSQTIPGALNGGNLVTFQTSDETTQQAVTYSNLPSGFSPGLTVLYETAGGASTTLDVLGSTTQYPAMPVSAYQSGDYYLFAADANSGNSGNEVVGVEKYTSSGGAQNFTFPAPWAYSGPTATALPTFNFGYSGFSGMSSVSSVATIQWNQGTGSPTSSGIKVVATANYQNGATTVTIPDLSGLAGFLAPAPSGSWIQWYAEIEQGDPGVSTPPSGTSQYVENNGLYQVP